MRLVDQSTRATVRTLTIMAALTALLLTMFTFAPPTAHAVSLSDWDTATSGPLPYTNFDDPGNDYGAHNPQAAAKVQVSGGNTTCMDLDPATATEVKFEVSGGTFVLEGDDNHGVVITNVYEGTVTDGDTIRTWTFVDFVSPDQPVSSVFVKQATGGVWFNYGSATSSADHHLHSQDQGDLNGGIDAISHISFCFGEVIPPPVSPTVTLVKTVDNTNGGTLGSGDFPVYVNDNQVSWGVAITVTPGEHVMSEEQQSGYVAGPWGGDCAADGTLITEADTAYTCTITNTAGAASLTLVKEVLIGDLGPSAFPLLITDGNGATQTVSSGQVTTLPAGTYTIGEDQQEGYELVDIECDNGVVLADGEETVSVTVGLTEAVECFIINAESVVLGEVVKQPETVVLDEVVERPVVRVLPAVEQLPATGLDTLRLALLSALIAALGVMFLLGTAPAPATGRRRRG